MKDLKHLIWFEDLLQQANNELVQRAAAEGSWLWDITATIYPKCC